MVYEKPTDEEIETRFSYHAPKNDQAERYILLRRKAGELARDIVRHTPACDEQRRSLAALDVVVMLANAAIARRE